MKYETLFSSLQRGVLGDGASERDTSEVLQTKASGSLDLHSSFTLDPLFFNVEKANTKKKKTLKTSESKNEKDFQDNKRLFVVKNKKKHITLHYIFLQA